MSFKVEIEGFAELQKKLKDIPVELVKDPTRLGLLKGVIVAEGAAKDYIGQVEGQDVGIDDFQVDAFRKTGTTFLSNRSLRRQTGRLASSITHRVSIGPSGFEGQVGTNVEYAAIHEKGGVTKKGAVMPARPYLLAGVLKVKEDITRFLKEEWNKYLKGKSQK